MTDKFTTLKAKYKHQCPAEALFFSNGNHKALRLEVPDLGKEFTDNAYIGKDPEGTFFYNSVKPLVPSTPDNINYYKISRIINPSDNKACSYIQFYHESTSNCYAEFLAYDPDETVQASGLNDYSSKGDWNSLTLGSTTASVLKYEDKSTFSLTAEAINEKAAFKDSSGYLSGVEVDVKGNLFFKNIRTLAKGVYASYNNDRIVFYENDYSGKDFVAYFIPFEGLPTNLGAAAVNTKIFSGITWSLT